MQADVVTFAAHGVVGMGCITALTVQDTRGVHATRAVEPELVAAQLAHLLDDVGADAVKTGMLGEASVVRALVEVLASHGPPMLVCDPVLVSSSGRPLLDADGVDALREHLLPQCAVLTPNLDEAAVLLDWEPGRVLVSPEDTCRALLDLGPRAVVLKGGHAGGSYSEDLCSDGTQVTRLSARRVDTRNTHGTGCAFSAALCARLALGDEIFEAARAAKQFVTRALTGARERQLGGGHRPLDLGWPVRG